MRRFRIKISSSQAKDLAAVCALGPEGIAAAKRRVDSSGLTIRQSKVSSSLTDGLDVEAGEALRNVVFGLSGLWSRDVKKVPEVLDSVSKSLDRDFPNDTRFSNWKNCVSSLEELFTSEPVFLAAKAIDISYDFERVLTSSRVLTSLRPIFDIGRTRIEGLAVVQTLRLEYISSDGRASTLSVALDTDDLDALKNACEDGLKKATLSRNQLNEKWPTEVINAAEELE